MIIPKKISLQITNEIGKPVRVKNILIGIRTFATRKNDIKLYPFVSNENGEIIIEKDQILNAANAFISYGIMDYASLESAKSTVEIYTWNNHEIERHITFIEARISNYSKDEVFESMMLKINGEKGLSDYLKEIDDNKKSEIKELNIFKSAVNNKFRIKEFQKLRLEWSSEEGINVNLEMHSQ